MNKLLHKSQLFLNRNASTILTCLGSAGVIATSVLAVKSTPKALRLLEEAKKEKGEELTKLEVVKTAAPVYIPSVVMGASTIACIFGANILNKRQQAALMSAYALVNDSYKQYRNKVKEVYGEESDNHIIELLAEDENAKSDYIPIEDEKHLFFDNWSMRYFESTIREVRNAEYKINQDLILNDYVSMNHFYDRIGLERVEVGDMLGWSTYARGFNYGCSHIDFHHEKVVYDDGMECYILSMAPDPSMDYMDY